jgi:hypothetical protein
MQGEWVKEQGNKRPTLPKSSHLLPSAAGKRPNLNTFVDFSPTDLLEKELVRQGCRETLLSSTLPLYLRPRPPI